MGANSGNWDFTVDSEEQINLADELDKAADNFDSKVRDVYSDINEMGTYCVGSDYNAFKEGTNGYQQALSDLGDSMRLFSDQFEKTSNGTEELAKELIDIVDTCTSRYSN